MSTRDLLLAELYHTPRDSQALALVARHAPTLYFDTREPFLPLAAGYTIFNEDGPSPSFDRIIELRPEDKPAAALAIEYAIWWDWDIHHLYDLEHVWVYLDRQGQVVRVEGSWHGKYYDIPLRLEDGRAVLLSEPGKHAFAPIVDWFSERVSKYRRAETQSVSMHAHVLINNLFAGKIRQRVFDSVLVRSLLLKYAFKPNWNFTQRYTFHPEGLVPWADLANWIPKRVNAILERLDNTIRPENYRALRLISSSGTQDSLENSARAGADAVSVPLMLQNNRLMLGNDGRPGKIDLDEAFHFCRKEPMGAFLELNDLAVVDHLAWFVRSNELNSYAVVTSADPQVLSRYSAFIPGGITVIQLPSPDLDPVLAAQESGALFVNPRWEHLPEAKKWLTQDWIGRIHEIGLGIVSWPVSTIEEYEALQYMGLDVVWQTSPDKEQG